MTLPPPQSEPEVDATLVVRLESVVRTDVTLEGLFALLKRRPQLTLPVVWWWLTGRLAREVATRTPLDVRWLPYRASGLARLDRARERGVRTILVSRAASPLVDAVATHLGGFDQVHGGLRHDAAPPGLPADFRLVTHAGDRSELAKGARWIEFADATPPSGAAAGDGHPSSVLRTWLRALRVHQWAKNLLILVPLLAAHRVGEPRLLLSALIALAAFSACASSVYLVNDLLDLPSDRRHATKSGRPFASGALPLEAGPWLALLLLTLAIGGAFLLSPAFVALLATYWVITLSYSLWLKQVAILDVLTLSGLYTVRLLAGAVATGVAVSDWLLIFSTFLFLSLALVKRFSEVQKLTEGGEGVHGRGYAREDLPLLGQLGAASGYLSVLVLALYIHSPEISRLYARPGLLWLACPLALYWVSRVWLLAQRGQMDDDPVVFALRDRASHVVALLGLLLLWQAS